jgi:hypothetical protein
MKARVVVALVVPLVLLTSCGFFRSAGPQTTEERPIAGVTGVELLTSGALTITPGTTEKLSVTAGANQLVGLTSQVINGTLILDKKTNEFSDGEIRYALTVPPLRRVQLSGSGNAEGVSVLTGDAQVTVTGSGSATLTGLDLTSVTVDLTGSGSVELGGRSGTQRITSTGSGDYRGSGLQSTDAEVQVGGSGDAAVTVTGSLTATVTGSGNVTYGGNPKQVTQSDTGSGEIVPG